MKEVDRLSTTTFFPFFLYFLFVFFFLRQVLVALANLGLTV